MSDALNPQPEVCRCGHAKTDHVYHESVCRPAGIVCECTEFRQAQVRMMILPRKVGGDDPMSRWMATATPEQMEALLDERSPGWRERLPRLELMPEGDPYWKSRAIELGSEVLDLRLEVSRLRRMVIGCDCGIIHDAYNELRDEMTKAQIELRKTDGATAG